ncbi:hypothetical protein ACFP47_09220 [Nesterenkonia lacusekhoensis]|uniref:DUF222 domain-containing protein n=1 Tax=Nesterenkonia lacusekhoensis TaxID=150832 RepID=A0ABS4SYX5_9MICC|nr:hypothetical protein [Nesterenkonia lacusekhoensis]MBP2317403.1 hypothetical protein [Nesterenkonia lacusekhoensis]
MTENAAETISPETYDIEAWLNDAHLPEESARIYRRGDLLGSINALQDRIRELTTAVDSSTDLDDTKAFTRELSQARSEYEELLTQFGESGLTVFLQAVPSRKTRQIRRRVNEAEEAKVKAGATRQDAKVWGNEEFIYSMVAAAVVGVEGPDGVRHPAEWDADILRELEDRIGPGQFGELLEARKRADGKLQEPDPDFLLTVSGTSNGDTDG